MKIGLLDYGAGNLGSMRSALNQLNLEFKDISYVEEIDTVDTLIIPGVGAFNSGMINLNRKGMTPEILNFAKAGKKILGICLGMHVLASTGDEGGYSNGLGLIPGSIKKLEKNMNARVPHLGWDGITFGDSSVTNYVYFAHSYYFELNRNSAVEVEASFDWNGHQIPAVIRKNNLIGIQFHPEKSANFGLNLLDRYVRE